MKLRKPTELTEQDLYFTAFLSHLVVRNIGKFLSFTSQRVTDWIHTDGSILQWNASVNAPLNWGSRHCFRAR
jgi:hypothetical protein